MYKLFVRLFAYEYFANCLKGFLEFGCIVPNVSLCENRQTDFKGKNKGCCLQNALPGFCGPEKWQGKIFFAAKAQSV